MQNRKIAFRAWSKESKSWYQGQPPMEGGGGITVLFETNEIVLMQFTGLLDKNGKEIYEGDVVKNHVFDSRAVVVFEDGMFCESVDNTALRTYVNRPSGNAYEIIGNVYENPDLLK